MLTGIVLRSAQDEDAGLALAAPGEPMVRTSPGWEQRLLPVAHLAVFLLFCGAIGYLPTYAPFNPDEALIVNTLRDQGPGWFPATSWVRQSHLMAQVDYYLIAQLGSVTLRLLKLAAVISMVGAVLYLVWLTSTYALLRGPSLLALLVIVSTNVPVGQYGNWGVFDYAQRVLVSVGLLHALLYLHRTALDPPRAVLWILPPLFCLLTLGYAGNVLPIVVLVCVALWSTGERLVPRLRSRATVNALRLGAPPLALGLMTLLFFTHVEFADPRRGIQWMYFPESDYAGSVSGLSSYLVDMTTSFLSSTFDTLALPEYPIATWLAALFGIGLVRSLVSPRGSPRHAVGLFVLLAVAGLGVLGAAGIYAYGGIRYALFLHGPLVLVAALGVADVGGWAGSAWRAAAGRLPSPVTAGARAAAVCLLVAVTLTVALLTAARTLMVKSNFDRAFRATVDRLAADDAAIVALDAYAQPNLEAAGIRPPAGRTVLFSTAFVTTRPGARTTLEDFEALLATGADMLWVTYGGAPADRFPDYVEAAERRYAPVRQTAFDAWHVIEWESCGNSGVADGTGDRADPRAAGPVDRTEALRLVAAYGTVLEQAQLQGVVLDIARLPASKARLKSALLDLLATPVNPDDPTGAARLRASYVLLARFQDGVGEPPLPEDTVGPDCRLWRDIVRRERETLEAELAGTGF